MGTSREQFREALLGFLWRQWSALGVAGTVPSAMDQIIDPEALLLATTTLGREPRLFDEVMDWLNNNGQLINLQRLQNLGRHMGDLTVLRPIAAHLARRAVHSKWKTLVDPETPERKPQLLFPGVPVFGPADELFARHGWLRGPLTLRRLSLPPDPHRPTNLLIKLRALFGMQARAEVMAYLLAKDSGYAGKMAEQLVYFTRTLQTTLNDLERSGHLESRHEGHEKRFWLRHDDWRFLMPGVVPADPQCSGFPRWTDWRSFFVAMESISGFLDRQDLEQGPGSVRAIELRACLSRLDTSFLRENLYVPPSATADTYTDSVLKGFLQLLKADGKPEATKPGSPPGSPSAPL